MYFITIIVYIIVSWISFKWLQKLQKRHYAVEQQVLSSNKKCLKQQIKIDTLQSELYDLYQLKDRNGELTAAKDKMQQELNEYKTKNNKLRQQNKDQLNKINDMKSENDAIKSDVHVFQQINKNLIHRIDLLKNKENQLSLVIRQLKNPLQLQDSDIPKHMKNPYFALMQKS